MVASLSEAIVALKAAGHESRLEVLAGSCYVQVARNELLHRFMDSGSDVAVFWDDDVSLAGADVLRLVEAPDDVVAACYRYKTEEEDYPVVVRCDDEGVPITRADGCIDAVGVPAGMLAVKRGCIEQMQAGYPQQRYFKREKDGTVIEGLYDLFPQGLKEGQWVGEDFAFCRLWTDLGGKIWVIPDIDTVHHAWKAFAGNYHRFLLRQPGGSEGPPWELRKAGDIGGWLTLEEGAWLAEQANSRRVIVEIGSCYGRSTRAMADNTEGVVYAVDDWKGPRDNGRLKVTNDPKAGFLTNCKDLIDAGKVVPVTADHGDFARLDELPDPDMVFIDGDHSAEAVSRDISYWQGRLQPGGLLCGHDFDWNTVSETVTQLLPEAEKAAGALWVYRQPVREYASA